MAVAATVAKGPLSSRRSSIGTIKMRASTTETHTLRLEGLETLPSGVGQRTDGPEFEVGGHPWRLEVYAGGYTDQEFVAVYLAYRGRSTEGVPASYKLTATHSHPSLSARSFPQIKGTHSNFARLHGNGLSIRRGKTEFIQRSLLAGCTGTLSLELELTVQTGDECRTTLVTIGEPHGSKVIVPGVRLHDQTLV